jgi:outer membrane protein assembly factor BamB
MLRPLRTTAFLAVAILLAIPLSAAPPKAAITADWPHWRGPDNDNVSKETGLLKEWPAGGPKLAWDLDLEGGDTFASVAIVGERLYTMANTRGKGGCVVCADLVTHKLLWAAKTTGNGPANATPTVDDGLVYALSKDGGLACFRADSGEPAWSKHLQQDLGGGKTPNWQFAESPLVDGDRLIVTPGGDDDAMAALDKKTGDVIWKCALPPDLRGKDVHAQYASVVISQAGGVRQYITLLYKLGAVGVDAKTGKFLWNYKKVNNGTANCSTPVAFGDYVFCSTAYETGAALLKLDGATAREEYFLPAKTFQSHHGGFVRIGDYLYGGSGHNAGNPTCIEWKTGKVLWQQKQIGKGSGSVTAADGHLYFLWEDGTVALVDANPQAYKLAGQFQLPRQDGPAWAHPVVAGGKLYLRWAAKLFCYDVKLP